MEYESQPLVDPYLDSDKKNNSHSSFGHESQEDFIGGDSWENARKIASYAVRIPSFLSDCVRVLRSSFFRDEDFYNSAGTTFIDRMMTSTTLATSLSMAAHAFFPEKVDVRDRLSARELQKIFSGEDLAALLALLVMYRRVSRGAEASSRRGLSRFLHLNATIGAYVGRAIPEIGLAQGILAGSMRHIGLAVFMRMDPKDWVKYRKSAKQRGILYDYNLEEEYWGCNHVQVASVLMQISGLGASRSVSFAEALVHDLAPRNSNGELSLPFRVADVWINSLVSLGRAPEITHQVDYYPVQESLSELLVSAKKLLRTEEPLEWLEKSADSGSSSEKSSRRGDGDENWMDEAKAILGEDVLRDINRT